MQSIAATTPLEQLLVETDAPWLAPEPFRGKTNEPAYIPFIIEKIASLKKKSKEEVSEAVFKNAKEIFHL
jgi:TatD DNase family protein